MNRGLYCSPGDSAAALAAAAARRLQAPTMKVRKLYLGFRRGRRVGLEMTEGGVAAARGRSQALAWASPLRPMISKATSVGRPMTLATVWETRLRMRVAS